MDDDAADLPVLKRRSKRVGVEIMAPRASWKGYIKLSLVSCPVRLYPATSSSERIASTSCTRTPTTGST
jgi:hypothetical protein